MSRIVLQDDLGSVSASAAGSGDAGAAYPTVDGERGPGGDAVLRLLFVIGVCCRLRPARHRVCSGAMRCRNGREPLVFRERLPLCRACLWVLVACQVYFF